MKKLSITAKFDKGKTLYPKDKKVIVVELPNMGEEGVQDTYQISMGKKGLGKVFKDTETGKWYAKSSFKETDKKYNDPFKAAEALLDMLPKNVFASKFEDLLSVEEGISEVLEKMKLIDSQEEYTKLKKELKDLQKKRKLIKKKSIEAKLTPEAQEFISKKIKILMEEGKPQDQAVAIAYSMAKEKGFDVPTKSTAKISVKDIDFYVGQNLAYILGTDLSGNNPHARQYYFKDDFLRLPSGWSEDIMASIFDNGRVEYTVEVLDEEGEEQGFFVKTVRININNFEDLKKSVVETEKDLKNLFWEKLSSKNFKKGSKSSLENNIEFATMGQDSNGMFWGEIKWDDGDISSTTGNTAREIHKWMAENDVPKKMLKIKSSTAMSPQKLVEQAYGPSAAEYLLDTLDNNPDENVTDSMNQMIKEFGFKNTDFRENIKEELERVYKASVKGIKIKEISKEDAANIRNTLKRNKGQWIGGDKFKYPLAHKVRVLNWTTSDWLILDAQADSDVEDGMYFVMVNPRVDTMADGVLVSEISDWKGKEPKPLRQGTTYENASHEARNQNLIALYIADGYLAGVSSHRNADDIEFWPSGMYQESDWELVELKNVPEELAEQLEAQGTSDQYFSDGYEAAEGARKYARKVIDSGSGSSMSSAAKIPSTPMQCMECGNKFKKKIGPRTFEVKCPKCKSTDVDLDYFR